MDRFPAGFDVGGAVRAEIFVIWLNGPDVHLTGPSGPEPWVVELEASDHPVEVVDRLVREGIGEPRLIHSTSWRHDGDAVILSFIVVIDAGLVGKMESAPIPRVTLARSEPTAAPDSIAREQVMEHALRHLAWLALDDPVVSERLPGPWRSALRDYIPEPFRNLG
jgi:hypothetical protein